MLSEAGYNACCWNVLHFINNNESLESIRDIKSSDYKYYPLAYNSFYSGYNLKENR